MWSLAVLVIFILTTLVGIGNITYGGNDSSTSAYPNNYQQLYNSLNTCKTKLIILQKELQNCTNLSTYYKNLYENKSVNVTNKELITINNYLTEINQNITKLSENIMSIKETINEYRYFKIFFYISMPITITAGVIFKIIFDFLRKNKENDDEKNKK